MTPPLWYPLGDKDKKIATEGLSGRKLSKLKVKNYRVY
jgi:hypothetical protein